MAKTSLTIALHGAISPVTFGKAINQFHSLLEQLARAILPSDEVPWRLDDGINPGGSVTVWGETTDPESGALIAAAVLDVSRALAAKQPTSYPLPVAKAAQSLVRVLEDGVDGIRIETADGDVMIPRKGTSGAAPTLVGVYGAIERRVFAVSGCCPLRFSMLDTLRSGIVTGCIDESWGDRLRAAQGRRAIIEGWLTEETETARPLTIRRISHIALLGEVEPGSLIRQVRGIAPALPGDPSAEEVIRQARDAWDD